MLRAKTLIECYILLNKVLNTKIGRIIHLDVTLFFIVLLLNLELVCKVYEFLSEK